MPGEREVPQVSGRDHLRSSLGRRGKDKAVAGVRQKERGSNVLVFRHNGIGKVLSP